MLPQDSFTLVALLLVCCFPSFWHVLTVNLCIISDKLRHGDVENPRPGPLVSVWKCQKMIPSGIPVGLHWCRLMQIPESRAWCRQRAWVLRKVRKLPEVTKRSKRSAVQAGPSRKEANLWFKDLQIIAMKIADLDMLSTILKADSWIKHQQNAAACRCHEWKNRRTFQAYHLCMLRLFWCRVLPDGLFRLRWNGRSAQNLETEEHSGCDACFKSSFRGCLKYINNGIEVSILETIPKSSYHFSIHSIWWQLMTLPSGQSLGIRSSWIKIYNASPSRAAQQHQMWSRSQHLRSMFQIVPSPREWTGAALGLPKILCLSRRACLKKLLYSQREENPTWLSVSVCNAHKAHARLSAIKELEALRGIGRECHVSAAPLFVQKFDKQGLRWQTTSNIHQYPRNPKQFWSERVSISIGSHSARENAGSVRSIGHCRIGLCQPNYIQLVMSRLHWSRLP